MYMVITTNEEIKTLICDAFLEAFNAGNLSVLDTVCAPNIIDHRIADPSNQAYKLEAFKGSIYRQRVEMPDLYFSITNAVCEGYLIAYQWEMVGTNTGPYLGYPPSGNTVRVTGMNLARLENGRIVEHWSYSDKLALMQQLGAVPV